VRLLTVGVSGCYAWKHLGPSRRQLDDPVFLAHIRSHFAASSGTYGSPRMQVDLCEEGLHISGIRDQGYAWHDAASGWLKRSMDWGAEQRSGSRKSDKKK